MKTITEEKLIPVTGPMANPPHPGESLREDVLPALRLTINEAANQLHISRQSLSAVLNGRAAITPEMALRIEKWLGVDHGGRAEVWLALQAAYDLAETRRTAKRVLATVRVIELGDLPMVIPTGRMFKPATAVAREASTGRYLIKAAKATRSRATRVQETLERFAAAKPRKKALAK